MLCWRSWRRSFVLIVWGIKNYYKEFRRKGTSNEQKNKGRLIEMDTFA